ncbi:MULTISPECIES: ADP-ribosylglycohydrolase family protein [Pasteurellaceae]|uniref:ADP-ribosylglycohydrolase n=1 Tax=Rodentibacter genomosp. 2 TaxID=1908266 RepID=A0A1V3JRM1_9PAST|nr:ADP-ribosylglycohydrolase family protein [Rodentibacter genomosp. 2]MBF0752015.1 ADP-ribosylglycohydrolase family protein [Pasteurella sp. 19428wF3_WM03]OOF59452.1 ADP-ribosylglycohydrolase [Rodentibacter genomosp. 2]TFU50853.1 ADP-ribosylglycohydrolase [Pasteurella sp. WM03]
MLGAIVGDVVGSRFECNNYRATDFKLIVPQCRFTDDTVCTIAVADWLNQGVKENLVEIMRYWGLRYYNAGYGGMFYRWLNPAIEPEPYNSWGNGSAMRVSPVGWAFDTLEETLEYAKRSAEITHNHPEGIKGAQATATAIFLARTTKDKTKIKAYIEETFGYNLSQTCDEIRPEYKFDVSCQGSVPQAIVAFLESENFEHAIRLAVSLGGDSDTIAAITGSISEAFYGEIPSEIVSQVIPKLPQEFLTVLEQHKMLRKSR